MLPTLLKETAPVNTVETTKQLRISIASIADSYEDFTSRPESEQTLKFSAHQIQVFQHVTAIQAFHEYYIRLKRKLLKSTTKSYRNFHIPFSN